MAFDTAPSAHEFAAAVAAQFADGDPFGNARRRLLIDALIADMNEREETDAGLAYLLRAFKSANPASWIDPDDMDDTAEAIEEAAEAITSTIRTRAAGFREDAE